MYRLSQKRLARLLNCSDGALLKGGRKGIEKESLRITPNGNVSRRPHPEALGSALTNRYLTTDYSEALLEFVTPAFAETWEAIQFLCDIHQFVYQHLGEELLWVTSMPCAVAGDVSVPIANYGTSNVGTMKHIYRRGLGHRYGRLMQIISGVHFNYSLPCEFWPVFQDQEGDPGGLQDFISARYFDLLRNFRRHGWLVLYLFGASPVVCKSFLRGQSTGLEEFDQGSYYEPYATSLRMSDLGYKSHNQASLNISMNAVAEYIEDLSRAISTPYPPYEQVGVLVDGEYRQLNANLLQIENEYYGFIRPKRVAKSGERPTHALRDRGVEYVELRALDVSVFDPVGVNSNQLRFLEAFLVFCMLQESPLISAAEQQEIEQNQAAVAKRGRDPELQLRRNGGAQALREWAGELVDAMEGVCELLDHAEKSRPYASSLSLQRELIGDADRTPSARILAEMRDMREPFFPFAMQMSRIHKSYFEELHAVDPDREQMLQQEAVDSLTRQQEIEAADQISFGEYLDGYFA